MKILYVLDHYPVLSQTFVHQEIAELRRRGHEIEVVALRRGDTATIAGADRVLQSSVLLALWAHARMILTRPIAYIRVLSESRWLRPRDAVWYIFAPTLWMLQRRNNFAIVHTHFALRAGSIINSLAPFWDAQGSVSMHAYDIFVNKRALRRRVSRLRVLTISEVNRRYLSSIGIPVEAVVPCGVRLPETVASAYERDRVVLAVGRLTEKKGFDVLAKAWALAGKDLDGWRCVIVGDGPERELLERATVSSSSGPELVGALSNAETRLLMESAAVLVVPSKLAADGDVDGLPVVLLEGMASGMAVIASDIGAISEVVRLETGWLVTAGDTNALVRALREATSDAHERDVRGRQARDAIAGGRTLAHQVDAMEVFFAQSGR